MTIKQLKKIKELQKEGWSYRKIASEYDVSFQRIHQIIKRYNSYKKAPTNFSNYVLEYLFKKPTNIKVIMDFIRFIKNKEKGR